jgi:DNA-binding beta-propeller fold protein YncE
MTLVARGLVEVPPGAAPGFDHADVHLGSRRLYVAHTGADRIDVIDCADAAFMHSLDDLPGVAGVLVDAVDDVLISSDRGCRRISLWRLPGEQLLGRVGVDAHPNGLAYDPTRRRIFVFCLGDPPGHDPTCVVVDLDARRIIEQVPVSGRPRWAIYDRASDRVFANIREPAQIIAIDPGNLRIERALDVPAAGPHGLALDGDRLFCAADAGMLAVLDRDSGSVLADVRLPGEPDVLWHDPASQRAYVAIGDPGCVCVVDTRTYEVTQTLATAPGSHTTAWNAATRTLYAFLPAAHAAAVYCEEDPA